MEKGRATAKALALALTLALAPAAARAGSNTATFSVQATIQNNCAISATTLNFGTYDPTAATAATNTSTVTLTCTKNTAYSVSLAAASGFKMKDAAGDLLSYQLFSDTARTLPWDATHLVSGTAPSKSPIPLTVYGTISAGQDVPAGAYSDTVTAQVNF